MIYAQVQNADDAQAREVVLCLDWRTHGTASLAFDKLAAFQGPALLAYNSASFTDDDCESAHAALAAWCSAASIACAPPV